MYWKKRSRSYTSKQNLDGFLNIERESYKSIKGFPRFPACEYRRHKRLGQRVTGRKSRGPQEEESNHKCQAVFPPSLYTFKKFLLKLCCHDDTWVHLNLTFLKPLANQCIFLMEMFFLSYINELCIYLRICLSSSWFCLRLRTDNGSTNQYVLLIEMFF